MSFSDFQIADDCNAVDPAVVPRRLRSGMQTRYESPKIINTELTTVFRLLVLIFIQFSDFLNLFID